MAVLGGYFMITETLRYFNPIENGLLPFTKRSLILELLSYVGNVGKLFLHFKTCMQSEILVFKLMNWFLVFVFALFYLFLGLMTNFGVPVMLIWGFWQRRSNECQMWIATNIGTLGVISGIVIFECIEKLCNQDGPLALTMFGVWLLIFAIFLYGQFVVLNVITILEAEEALAPRPPTPLPPTPPRPAYFPRMGPLPLGSTSFGPPKKRRLRYVSRP